VGVFGLDRFFKGPVFFGLKLKVGCLKLVQARRFGVFYRLRLDKPTSRFEFASSVMVHGSWFGVFVFNASSKICETRNFKLQTSNFRL